MTWGARFRWVPANVGLGILTNFSRHDPLVVFIVGPVACSWGGTRNGAN